MGQNTRRRAGANPHHWRLARRHPCVRLLL